MRVHARAQRGRRNQRAHARTCRICRAHALPRSLLRHSGFRVQITEPGGPAEDFVFDLVEPLDRSKGGMREGWVSLRSRNFSDRFVRVSGVRRANHEAAAAVTLALPRRCRDLMHAGSMHASLL